MSLFLSGFGTVPSFRRETGAQPFPFLPAREKAPLLDDTTERRQVVQPGHKKNGWVGRPPYATHRAKSALQRLRHFDDSGERGQSQEHGYPGEASPLCASEVKVLLLHASWAKQDHAHEERT